MSLLQEPRPSAGPLQIMENPKIKPLRKIVEQADQLYAARSDISNVEKSVSLLRNGKADSFELAWRLARALFFLGQEVRPRNSAQGFHREGIRAGRRAVKERPERVEGHFWLGVNLALLAQLESSIKAAVHALQARSALRKAISIDATYHAAGPLRVLARLQHKLPRVLGGGVGSARDNYEQALRIAAANTVTRMYFAELLYEIGEVEPARAELEAVLKAPLDPDWAFEIERDQAAARERIKQLGEVPA